jgi:DNA-binding CsgD family transcriptional regulator
VSVPRPIRIHTEDTLRVVPAASFELPTCSAHPGSLVRRYRSHGPNGPGVYPQCVPGGGEQPHLLEWRPEQGAPAARLSDSVDLSPSELEVLEDAANGMTVPETAVRRWKGVETVKTQRRSILLKLGARNMAQAVAMTARDGLLEHRRAA